MSNKTEDKKEDTNYRLLREVTGDADNEQNPPLQEDDE